MFYVRIIVSVLVLVIVLAIIPWDDFIESNIWSQLIGWYLFLAGILVLIDRVVNACRWYLLIDHRKSNLYFRQVLSIYFKSAFLGLIVPSSAGGELLKGYGLMKSGYQMAESFSSVFVERLFGLVALVLTCIIGFFMFYKQLKIIPIELVERMFVLVFMICLCGIVVSYFFFRWFEQWVNPESKIALRLKEIRCSLQYYQKIKMQLVLALGLSFLVQIIRIFFTWLIGLGVGISLELPYYVLFVPVISLVSMIPISIAGIGVQEGAFIYFFSLTETNMAMVLVMALFVRLFVTVSVLPGGIFYAQEGLGTDSTRNEKEIFKE
ncbi:MAG: hypothetical protein NPIRA02_15250 [Nitrospirales bacterium]|nr:MAG: hypothetical protein NPIRA02_15250 [Nitrospirales bacterium]